MSNRLIIGLVLALGLVNCSTSRYVYVAEEPVELYEFASFSGTPVLIAKPGDTLSATGASTVGLGGSIPVEYQGYRFYSPAAKARLVSQLKVNRHRDQPIPGITYKPRKEYERQRDLDQLTEAYIQAQENIEWYGRVDYPTPVLKEAFGLSREIDTLPAKTILKVKRHDENYWQVLVNGTVGYVAAYSVQSFSKSQNPFVPTAYTGRTYALGEAEYNQSLYSTPTTGATIHTGPRGGRYYYNSKGNKTYIKPNSGSYRPSSGSYRYRSSSRGRR